MFNLSACNCLNHSFQLPIQFIKSVLVLSSCTHFKNKKKTVLKYKLSLACMLLQKSKSTTISPFNGAYLWITHGFYCTLIGRPEGGKTDQNISIGVLVHCIGHVLVH